MAKRKRNRKDVWTQARFAKLLDTDQAVVARLINREILTRGATWQQWVRELYKHYSSREAGRSSEKLNLADERARLAMAQAAKINFDLAIQRRQFLSTEAIAHRIVMSIVAIKAKLLHLPTSVASQLPQFAKVIFEPLTQIVRDCLTEISRIKLPPELDQRIREIDEEEYKRAIEGPAPRVSRNGTQASASSETNRSRRQEKTNGPLARHDESVATATENENHQE